MTYEPVNWGLVSPNEWFLWYRTHSQRHLWKLHGIASKEVCERAAAQMLVQHPRRSILILRYKETPCNQCRTKK